MIDNLLHCLHHGAQLGWLVDPIDYSVLVLKPQQEISVCRDQQQLQVLPEFELQLTAREIFSWLQVGKQD